MNSKLVSLVINQTLAEVIMLTHYIIILLIHPCRLMLIPHDFAELKLLLFPLVGVWFCIASPRIFFFFVADAQFVFCLSVIVVTVVGRISLALILRSVHLCHKWILFTLLIIYSVFIMSILIAVIGDWLFPR